MKKSALGFLALASLFSEALFGSNEYIEIQKTWWGARDYCRENHINLSSIYNQRENENFPENTGYDWIGLRRDKNDVWRWPGGARASFFNWLTQPVESEYMRCVARTPGGWQQMNCDKELSFFCYHSSQVLVKEKKTWEEAMEHCRRDNSHDLVSLPSERAMAETQVTSREAQTDHVWTGLRFLADKWLWVNGDNSSYKAWGPQETPRCPGWSRRCGAFSWKEKHWESWDCADKLNFVCDKKSMS